MRSACRDWVQSILQSSLPSADAAKLARHWCDGVKVATKAVQEAASEKGLSLPEIRARALATNAAEFDRLDQQNERHEYRRDLLLKEIERRRAGWAREVKRASEEIIDADYSATPPNGSARKDLNRLD
jgi:hypothetical protein